LGANNDLWRYNLNNMAIFDSFGNSYSINVECTNCKKIYVMRIPKGITVNDYINKTGCKMCGCKTVKIMPAGSGGFA